LRAPRTPGRLFYTTMELAMMAGVSRFRLMSMLEANQVRVTPATSGQRRRGVVFISELTAALPEMVDSIRMRRDLEDDDE
jgi:hypothetical protein